jgi:phage FluMu protein Com
MTERATHLPSTIRCTGCGKAYSHAAWRDLPTLRTLTPRELRAHVVTWPSTCHVEVRACDACGRSLARTSRAAHASPHEAAPDSR